jgi:hypothetical protein
MFSALWLGITNIDARPLFSHYDLKLQTARFEMSTFQITHIE